MPVPFTCPHCGVQTDVADELAGRSGPCANCGGTITVPAVPRLARGGRWLRGLALMIVAACVVGVVVVCGGLLVKFSLPAVQAARQAELQARCQDNLQQIATAMFQYRGRYDTFPPAYIADADGRPMHSWRVLILPFLGCQSLYDQYDFGQPWDGPDNRALIDQIPQLYRCPADPGGRASETSYLMVVGPGTFSTVTGPMRLDSIPDGPVNTLMLVETVNSGIAWTQPQDFAAGQMSLQVNDPAGRAISSHHPGGAIVALGDGSVRFLSEWTAPEQVQAMTTIDGGEIIGPE